MQLQSTLIRGAHLILSGAHPVHFEDSFRMTGRFGRIAALTLRTSSRYMAYFYLSNLYNSSIKFKLDNI